jgi:putative NADPH-quinone reductase
MKVLIVLAHYREDSLTYKLKEQFEKGVKEIGHQVDTLDLYKIKFNPVFTIEDEPAYFESEQNYPEDMVKEMERLNSYDAIVFVFPLYWYTMPAILKGYIDRVWNFNFAHGPEKTLELEKVLWMPLCGGTENDYQRMHPLGETIDHLYSSILNYCGGGKTKVKKFFGTMRRNDKNIAQNIQDAYQEGLDFDNW